jgi:hypothetical protein
MKDLPDIPVYVTRPTSGGTTGSVSASPYLLLVLWLITVFNVLGWGTFSLALLVKTIIDQF